MRSKSLWRLESETVFVGRRCPELECQQNRIADLLSPARMPYLALRRVASYQPGRVHLTSGTSHPSKADAALAGLLDQVTRHIHSSNHAADLYPAQWSALRYFAKANAPHRSAISLARYQGIEPGPTTRTVRTLISKGLLEDAGSLGRGRIRRVDVTDKGRELLLSDPLNTVVEALASLDGVQKRALAEALERMLVRLQSKKRQPEGSDPSGAASDPE